MPMWRGRAGHAQGDGLGLADLVVADAVVGLVVAAAPGVAFGWPLVGRGRDGADLDARVRGSKAASSSLR